MKILLSILFMIFTLSESIIPSQHKHNATEEHSNVWYSFRQYQSNHANKDLQRTTQAPDTITTCPAKKIMIQTPPDPQVIFDDDEDQYSQYEDAIELMKTFPENQNKKHIEKILADLRYTDKEGLHSFINEYNKHDLPIKKSFAALFFNAFQDNDTPPKAPYYPTMRLKTNMSQIHRLIFDPNTHQIIPLAIPHNPVKHLEPVNPPAALTMPNKPSIVAQLISQPQSPKPSSAPPNKNNTPSANTVPSVSKPQINLVRKNYYTVQLIKNCLRLFGIDVDALQQKQKKVLEISQCIIGFAIIGAMLTFFITQPGITS